MWYQLQIDPCQADEVEVLSKALEETGALSITLTDKFDNPILEPEPGTTPLWADVIMTALYGEEQMAIEAKLILSHQFPHLYYSINELADQNWERVWMDEFKPKRFGERLWICPSWIEVPDPSAVNLILDPGLAFGTGTHPTTSLCLHWLDQFDLKKKRVIDYGCGSGILSLAAIKLGATFVEAVDIDEQALQATKANALNNQINHDQLWVNFPESLEEPADILIANILLAPLIGLKTRFKALIKDRGTLVVSGILSEQAPELIAAYEKDFNHLSTKNQEEWSLLTFQKL